MSYYDRFIDSLFPPQEHLIPAHKQTSDGWVVANSTLFNTQWIDCSYPISGGYGRGPRYVYYFLVFLAVVVRRKTWTFSVALASVMTYSGAAAVHAIILATIQTDLVPQYMFDNIETVLAGGNSSTGTLVKSTPETWREFGLWLPVLPMVWDGDGDAVFAIVGIAFLVVTPMQTWSRTFDRSDGKAVLLLWSLLLSVGMICALVNKAYISFRTFPQLRFCPLQPSQANDTLPLTNGGVDPIGGVWDRMDRYHWNKTVTSYFSNSTTSIANICIYPCFDTAWRLRDPTEIVASVASVGSTQISTNTAFVVYVFICSTGLSSLMIFVIKTSARARPLRVASYSDLKRQWGIALGTRPILSFNTAKEGAITLLGTWFWMVNLYAKTLSPIALTLFVVYVERAVWNDQGGENFRHVRQWGALVAAALVSIAAIVGQWKEFVAATKRLTSAAANFVRPRVQKSQPPDVELSENGQSTLGDVHDDHMFDDNAGLLGSKTW